MREWGRKIRKSIRHRRVGPWPLPGAALLAVLLLAAVAYAAWYFYIPPRTIVLREDGWHPRVMTIEPGQTITFVNHSSHDFWPASNNHPQHTLYPEFDVGHPVAPGQSWSFTFEKPGHWGFHDHLRSFYTGFVNVGKDAATYDCTEHMQGMDIGTKQNCWEERLREDLQLHGATHAFQLFKQYYESDPDFTKIGCHLIAHSLGDDAYGEYLAHGKRLSTMEFPPETVYCGYGYYHGILEHMIRDNPNYEQAANFCDWLTATHGKDLPRIRLNCYHAIGHGFIPEPSDPQMWGDVHALTAPAIAACKNIPADDARQECFQGAFNVLTDWMWNNQFGFRFPAKDPLSVCRSFDERDVSLACYYELSMKLVPKPTDTMLEVYNNYAANIADDYTADMVVDSAAASLLGDHIAQTNFIPFLMQCRALPARVQMGCMKGLSAAFIAHGDPGVEYVKAIAFCGDKTLTPSEKDTCFSNIIRMFKTIYTPEKVATVCKEVESPYQHYCAYDAPST